MTADFRALCVELLDCLEKADWPPRYKVVFQQWADIARTALAEPEPEEPTIMEIIELADEIEAAGLGQVDLVRAALARWGTPNLTETRRSLTDAWAAHQPAIEAAAKAGMDACRVDGPAVSNDREPASVTSQPSDHLYVHFASLEWKLGCHMAEWKAARDELNQAHCDGVVRLLREYLEAYGEA